MRAIRKHITDFLALVALFAVAVGVGGYILSNQRFYLPDWVPVVGSDFVDRKATLITAQAITPGQGQEVAIAGVKVGEVGSVDLVDGRAIVTMKVRRRYAQLYRDASILVRPKTGLNDMTLQLDPGSTAAGKAPAGWAVPVSNTLPNVNPDEILANLDGDTRDLLRLLLLGGGEGLRGNSYNLGNLLRRFEPTGRDLAAITKGLAERRSNISRSITNFRRVSEALGEKDDDLAQLVDSSNAVFDAFANQERSIRSTLQQLPPTVRTLRTTLDKADTLARQLGPATQELRPAARALAPAQRASRPFFRETEPVVREALRPFAREVRPTVRALRPAARDLSALQPDVVRTFSVINELTNTLAYNPPGSEEGYLFWAGWTNHLFASVFNGQDAHGPIRRGIFLASCSALTTLKFGIIPGNPQLGTLTTLLGPAFEACPTTREGGIGGATTPTATTSTTPAATAPAPAATARAAARERGRTSGTGQGAGAGVTTTPTTPPADPAPTTTATPPPPDATTPPAGDGQPVQQAAALLAGQDRGGAR